MPAQPLDIPPAFAEHMRTMYGARADAWLRELPALVADLAQEWGLTLGPPFSLSYNYVCPARRHDGAEAVLKVGFPSHELDREIAALRLYAGDGICRLLEADAARSAMLLERLRPGTMLVALAQEDDDAATRIGASVMRALWRPAPEPPQEQARSRFLSISYWFRAFARHRAAHGGPGPLPERVLAYAEAIVPDLLASAPAPVLLHGDFHHYNVLAAERAPWLAIDPKGMTGDPGYEAGPFLVNPDIQQPNKDARLLGRRLDILASELSYDRERLRQWGIAHAVLSACWSAEDEGAGWEGAVAVAETLIGL